MAWGSFSPSIRNGRVPGRPLGRDGTPLAEVVMLIRVPRCAGGARRAVTGGRIVAAVFETMRTAVRLEAVRAERR